LQRRCAPHGRKSTEYDEACNEKVTHGLKLSTTLAGGEGRGIQKAMTLPFRVKRIDHVAICVPESAGPVAKWLQLLGLPVTHQETVASQKTEATLLAVGEGDSAIELIVPKGNEGLERFLEKRGPGLHHVAIRVEGIDAALAHLKSIGVQLIDETPRIGAHGHRVAFIHPKATGGVLVELVESV
jgi:methylmalonyl-CoA/ethylmalonyl-CoA epimerase